jgi:hypothetical protein
LCLTQEMYYTNPHSGDASYGEHGEYLDNSSPNNFQSGQYFAAQGYGLINQSAGSLDMQAAEHEDISSSEAYHDTVGHESVSYGGIQSARSLLDDTLANAQHRLASWKSVSIRPACSVTSDLPGSQPPAAEYSVDETKHPGHNMGMPNRNALSYDPLSGPSVQPRPRLPAGIRTFQPRSAQLQRAAPPPPPPPPLPPAPRSSVPQPLQPAGPSRPMRMPHPSYDEEQSAEQWQAYDSNWNQNESEWYTGEDLTGYEENEAEAHFGHAEHPDGYHGFGRGRGKTGFDPGHMAVRAPGHVAGGRGNHTFGDASVRPPMGMRGPIGPGRGGVLERPGPRMGFGRAVGFGRGMAPSKMGASSGPVLPAPGHFRSGAMGQQPRPTGFGMGQPVCPPANLSKPNPAARGTFSALGRLPGHAGFGAYGEEREANTDDSLLSYEPRAGFGADQLAAQAASVTQLNENKTGPVAKPILKSALKQPVRSLMDMQVSPVTVKEQPCARPEHQFEGSRQHAGDGDAAEPTDLQGRAPGSSEASETPGQQGEVVSFDGSVEKKGVVEVAGEGEEESEEELDTSQCEICNLKFEKEQV